MEDVLFIINNIIGCKANHYQVHFGFLHLYLLDLVEITDQLSQNGVHNFAATYVIPLAWAFFSDRRIEFILIHHCF